MARESDAPKVPLPSRRPNEQPQSSLPQHPEFGKPSPLRPSVLQSNRPFNIPKPNRARPEHHRPQMPPGSNPQMQRNYSTTASSQTTASNTAARSVPPVRRIEPSDPFRPVKPLSHKPSRDEDVVEITRPENVLWSTPKAPRALYTSNVSKPPAMRLTNASKNLQNFIDLTTAPLESGTYNWKKNTLLDSMDPFTYVDAEKANQNIKALLEGAFEDEDEQDVKKSKRNVKSKKKKTMLGGDGKSKSVNRRDLVKESNSKNPDDIDFPSLDELASQLRKVTVHDTTEQKEHGPKEEASLSHDADRRVSIDIESESTAGDEPVAQEEQPESDEDEEEDEDDATLEGLKVTLLPHQVAGVNWMCNKETGRNKTKGILPKGGILADDMGLGKTVQAIALILRNKRPATGDNEGDDQQDPDDGESSSDKIKLPPGLAKTTLVVAPLALIKQWESEIADKVEKQHKLHVCVYHGATRAKVNEDLEDYDVVITTYGTLTSEFGASEKDRKKKRGIFSVYWYRVILDEAHTIKNRNAKATQAACAVDAEYRWCLTGTPLQNNLDELQSLIKFLRIQPYNDLAAWRDQISRPLANGRGGLAIQRLQVYLKVFMKRRTKDVLKLNDNLKAGDGEEKGSSSGFQITKREVIQVAAKFTPGEMTLYEHLEQRTDNSLERMMGGKLDYAGALVMLLRLRQACNHPDLLKNDLSIDKDALLNRGLSESQPGSTKQDDMDSVADLFGGLSVVSKICDICQAGLSSSEAQKGITRCSLCEEDLETSFVKVDKPKKKLKRKKEKHRSPKAASSGRAKSVPASQSDSQIARSHRNRRVVIDSDDEDEDAEWIVPESQRALPDLGQAGGTDDEDAEGGGHWLGSDDSETDTDDEEADSPLPKNRRPATTSSSSDEDSESDEDIYNSDKGPDPDLFASSKVRHLMKILKKEAFNHKFIVFSVFTSMLDKVEPFLNRAGIGYARYDGQMRNDHREANLNRLRNHGATRVLLCSLRAGALGLNLTAASRVVIMEPFWNPFVEEQAIDRVHRLNQTVDVKVYKLIIKDTVEERIVDLQNRKRELANMTIEGKAAAGKLTMRDMMALFGHDAEAKYASKHGDLDLTKTQRLLSSVEGVESAASFSLPSSSQGSGRSDGGGNRRVSPSMSQSSLPQRDRSRLEKPKRLSPRPEDSVYGRRW